MKQSRRLTTLLILLAILTSFACSVLKPTPTPVPPSPTAAVQALPTDTPEATPTNTIEPPTSTPTDTPAPTPTPTDTPTPLPPIPPRLAYHTPARGEEQSLDGTVVLTFDQPMDVSKIWSDSNLLLVPPFKIPKDTYSFRSFFLRM